MKKEIWVDIKGYEGLYQVSNFGRVRSLGNGKSNNSRRMVLKPYKTKKGYLHIDLFKDGVRKSFSVHRLVAAAFIPNWFDDPQVNHRDENKENNHIDNLEYCDNTYNCNYGTRTKRVIEKNTNGKCSKPVEQYTLSGEFVREWSSAGECGRNGFIRRSVSHCCEGKKKSHKGYIWKFKIEKEVV